MTPWAPAAAGRGQRGRCCCGGLAAADETTTVQAQEGEQLAPAGMHHMQAGRKRTAGGGRQPQQQRAVRAVERGGWVEAVRRGLLLHPGELVGVIVHARAIQVCRQEEGMGAQVQVQRRRRRRGWRSGRGGAAHQLIRRALRLAGGASQPAVSASYGAAHL